MPVPALLSPFPFSQIRPAGEVSSPLSTLGEGGQGGEVSSPLSTLGEGGEGGEDSPPSLADPPKASGPRTYSIYPNPCTSLNRPGSTISR